MTKQFLRALSFTLKAEGGFADVKGDLGGKTNYGITQDTYDNFQSLIGKPNKPVKDIPLTVVREIYWRQYWNEANCEFMPQKIATCVFDTAAIRDPRKSVIMLQELIGTKADGSFGVNSQKKLQDYLVYHSVDELCDMFIDKREVHHKLRALIPTQWKFLKGWLNRTSQLRAFVHSLKEEN